ncbi:hypothetical protein L484_027404 [Morus notabilis]|uniref:G protein gamma domain-containing protein n=1 Tax=Morus notabilis TaxID=981085 RepID=W9QSH3_9ROSA|nr:hypothetical protein L484_027404 [Morus notabilis]
MAAAGAAPAGRSSNVPSLPPPCPKSPPAYPDLYGKRREMAKVQMLEREIGFLQEELKSAERIQPSSRCCKEITEFVVSNPDPLIPTAAVALRVSLVRYQSGVAAGAAAAAAAAHAPDQIAVKTSRAAEIAAFFPPVHALIALPANANANAHALVLHVYRFSNSYSDMDRFLGLLAIIILPL